MQNHRLPDDLLRPEAYAHGPTEVGFLQTHVSWLFFADERVYKVKRPVDVGFLDATTLAARRHFCEEELRLNARLAPGIYLGLVPITVGEDGHLRVGGEGEAVEWAVEMVRLPAHRMLDRLLERGEIDNLRLGELAAILAEFHSRSATGPGVNEHGQPAAVSANVEENLAQLAPFSQGEDAVLSERQLGFLADRRRSWLTTHADLLGQRVAADRIREGHGDLHAGNLCFTGSGIVAYDALEFSPRYRCGDVAADVAFLAMDLDFRGYPGFSSYLVHRYAQASGDGDLDRLLPFYKGYRAVVRGKVAALQTGDGALTEERRSELRAESRRYLQLALGYETPPTLVLLCGLPACGKSYLAEHLARPLRAPLLRSDVRRKTLSGMTPTTSAADDYGAGLYSPERKRATYDSLLASAREHLAAGRSVLVDATFSRSAFREPFLEAARSDDFPVLVVHVVASEERTRARLEARAKNSKESSDADWDVYLHEREAFEPPTELPAHRVVTVASQESPIEAEASQVFDGLVAGS